MSPRLSKCRTCRASIVWATVKVSGKTMPVDAVAHERGTIRFLGASTVDVEVLGELDAHTHRGAGVPLFRAHFATCPNAKSHRRDREASR